jgi:hypothetical protein
MNYGLTIGIRPYGGGNWELQTNRWYTRSRNFAQETEFFSYAT